MKNDPKLKKWHKAVCEREKYICQGIFCQKNFNSSAYFNEKGVNQFVCGHHIKSQGSHPELRYDVNNGACVCMNCHNLVHRGLKKLAKNKNLLTTI